VKTLSDPYPIQYVAVDSHLGTKAYDLNIVEDSLESLNLSKKRVLLLQFPKTGNSVKEALEREAECEIIELIDKSNSYDIKSIFTHFATLEECPLDTIHDKIQFGKRILYLDAVSSSFIRRFQSNQECPGFWNMALGTYCRHGCSYCFLNLTMRIRPLCVEHLNLSRLKKNLRYFSRKRQPNILFNTGETSDPLDNEPDLHLWNKIVELVRASGNQLLCLTKSDHTESIPDAEGRNLTDTVIYSWSINPIAVVDRYEPHTAPTKARLQAAKHLKELGYRIRFRIDPIMPVNLMNSLSEGKSIPLTDIDLESYFTLIDKLALIEPEMITFGTFRALPALFNFLSDKIIKKDIFVKDGKRFRLPQAYRHFLYEKLGMYTQDLIGCNIAICKDPTIDLPFTTFKVPCQCMKINKK